MGTLRAACQSFDEYRKDSPAKYKDKQEETKVYNRCTDLLISMELLLQKKYNVNNEAAEVMQETGLQLREITQHLANIKEPKEALMFMAVLKAAVEKEIIISDEAITPIRYLIDGSTHHIYREADGWHHTLTPAVVYHDPAAALYGFQLANANPIP